MSEQLKEVLAEVFLGFQVSWVEMLFWATGF